MKEEKRKERKRNKLSESNRMREPLKAEGGQRRLKKVEDSREEKRRKVAEGRGTKRTERGVERM
jgi:hypothetical protein